ncbi:MerR family transcriptional regulator [Candidatus Hydrogenisulfobacillus filiaventi]|uniref:MerR family transcriptional regulator n=1 Tax=Candidatus Hydrogenisulfobacillus filiaventi TaxID=2707344 RepID=A0A6F8ZK42_9FIRM|nr:MerR family transcriptional regulator [Bacillota bacterium]CAB1130053.1 MerR family transcriptional regulator [Candidatus Hydrogenisulfobacillus filiaventi]
MHASPGETGFLRIGDLAAACGVTPRTLRYYEAEGLLPAPPRQGRAIRRYPPSTVERVRRIQALQMLLGWSLEEIRTALQIEDRLVELRTAYYGATAPEQRRAVLQQALELAGTQLARVRQRLEGLTHLEQELEVKTARYRQLLAELEDPGSRT